MEGSRAVLTPAGPPPSAQNGATMPTDANRAYQQLKDRIIRLELIPGSVIHDVELSRELGLGRTPIREALKLLEAEGLVITVPRRGIFVSHVSITDLQQISEIREELEGLSARLAAERATPADVARLVQCCEEQIARESHEIRARIAVDRQMHQLVAAATQNKFIESEIERFYDLSLRLWHLATGRMRPDQVDVASHVPIVGAIRRRDAAEAEELMREHIRSFHRSIKAAL